MPVIFLLFTIGLLMFSSYNLPAAKEGLTLWATSVVPSLFPFFIATELLSKTSITYYLGKAFNVVMKPFFNVRGEGSFCFIMGLISGYPTGAKIAVNFRENNILTKEECERLLSFTNNSGPLFILGTVGINMYGSTKIGIVLFIAHILASLTVGFIFRFWKKNSYTTKLLNHKKDDIQKNEYLSFSNLGKILSDSITKATNTIMMIGGFIVLFSVIISILKASNTLDAISVFFSPLFDLLHIPNEFINSFITGIFEITNGISSIASSNLSYMPTSIILTSFLLGFGGISVLLQVWSIISKSDLSIKPYIYGKILHGFISAFYTSLFLA